MASGRKAFFAFSLIILFIMWSMTSAGEKRFLVAGKSICAFLNSSPMEGIETKSDLSSSQAILAFCVSRYWI